MCWKAELPLLECGAWHEKSTNFLPVSRGWLIRRDFYDLIAKKIGGFETVESLSENRGAIFSVPITAGTFLGAVKRKSC